MSLQDDTTSRSTSFSLGQQAWMRALERTAPIERQPQRIFPALLEELADKFGDAPALISSQEALTFNQLLARSNQYTRWALELDLHPGTAVGLMMPNRPEYLAAWLGVTRAGCVAALLNTNLMGAALAHCMRAAAMKHLIAQDESCAAVSEALPLLEAAPTVWVHGTSTSNFHSLTEALDKQAKGLLRNEERRPITLSDRALYIYTSGTTGLPKAAVISHNRVMAWSHWFAGMMDANPADRMYNCLPLYHSVGGVAATGALLASGGSVFIRRKFSAKEFWDEVCANDCTLFQYIGELCRYLLNAPISPSERKHRLRLCCGNGLGGDIWPKFKERFQVPHILEFYAATEANFSLYNFDEEPGSVGRVPPFLAHRFPIKLIEIDPETLEPVRNASGLCVQAGVNQPGEAVFRIGHAPKPGASAGAASFEGYTSTKDSEKKILRDVLEKGDAWYRSGDMMRKSGKGFFYFSDRLGDTFRWKGENVSTSEVMHVVAACPGITEATVYGVAVPRAEGRAGMAALSIDANFDLALLHNHLQRQLPRYSQPLFLRIIRELELTSTFKPKKADLAREGYDPALVRDELYFNDHASGKFVKLDASFYEDITEGRTRL